MSNTPATQEESKDARKGADFVYRAKANTLLSFDIQPFAVTAKVLELKMYESEIKKALKGSVVSKKVLSIAKV